MLDKSQQDTVRQWVADGASLSEVQRRIQDEFGISMTYMDVRFLVLDLHAEIKDKPEPKPKEPSAPRPSADGVPSGEAVPNDGEGYTPEGLGGGSVSVTLDSVVRVGALASGSVTFSDGVTADWSVDRFGRLALTKVSQPGYQPKTEDLRAFQVELENKLSQRGY